MDTDSSSGPLTGPDAAAGPLVVCEANPRYFTTGPPAAGRRAVYLTGSHVWNMRSEPGPMPSSLSYAAFLKFLIDHGHNFIRLWRWEHFSQPAGAMAPQPWPRTGPGAAKDGKAKFDLSAFDQAYFARLRDRVIAAGNAGIYVAVMLFEGFGLKLLPAPDNVEGHPFHAANNINGIGITSITGYQVLPLDPRVQALQDAYVRKVVDTVGDLPNVLYEVVNESSGGGRIPQAVVEALKLGPVNPETGDSTRWQYRVISLIKEREQQMGYLQHPVGMTMQYPVADVSNANDPLFDGPADWVSPGGGASPFDDQTLARQWYEDPPANDARKVVITDTDHYAPGKGDALWAWKSFLRGHQPILMDFGITDGVTPGGASYEQFEPARRAMGDTLRYARRMNLTGMQPRGDLSSTGYALVNPGEEYLILQPGQTSGPFTATLPAGTYTARWHSVSTRQTKDADELTAAREENTRLAAPFPQAGPVVVHLKRAVH